MTKMHEYVGVECCEFIMIHSAATSNPELREMLGITDEQAVQIASLAIDESLAKIISAYLPNASDALAFIDEMESHSAPWINELLESAKTRIEGGI